MLGDRYRVEARIGSGGMGEVYRGVDTVLDRTVAIKILLAQFARDVSFVERFRREAQAAARLNHPNIVGIYDSGADGETQFIVMEFIEGRTLADFMSAGGRFTPAHAVEVSEKICDALAYAHVAGVIHRDIKPANVMVTRKGEVKVMDFGIARIVAGPQTAPQTSAVLGTAAYISPEQAQGQAVDGRSDIYSLGAVLYEMVTGRPPFVGDSPVAVAYKQVNESPMPPSLANAEVSPRLDAVLMRALAKNPANRYQTAEEFRADLERARRGQDVQATPLMPPGADATQVISRPQQTSVLPPQEAPAGSGRKVWLGVLIGILAVAVLAGGGYLLAKTLLSNYQGCAGAGFGASRGRVHAGPRDERARRPPAEMDREAAGQRHRQARPGHRPGSGRRDDPEPRQHRDDLRGEGAALVDRAHVHGLVARRRAGARVAEPCHAGPDRRRQCHRRYRKHHQPGPASRDPGAGGDPDPGGRLGPARHRGGQRRDLSVRSARRSRRCRRRG